MENIPVEYKSILSRDDRELTKFENQCLTDHYQEEDYETPIMEWMNSLSWMDIDLIVQKYV